MGNFADAFSRSASFVLLMPHCMLDWPAHTHTSPMSTSLNVTVFFPFTVSVCGPPYSATGFKSTLHIPSAPAVVECTCEPNVTVIGSLGSALPQTLFPMPCWSTMWSPNILLSETSARRGWSGEAATTNRPAIAIGRHRLRMGRTPECRSNFPIPHRGRRRQRRWPVKERRYRHTGNGSKGVCERSTSIRRRGPRKETFATPFFAGAPSKSNTIYRKNSTLSRVVTSSKPTLGNQPCR